MNFLKYVCDFGYVNFWIKCGFCPVCSSTYYIQKKCKSKERRRKQSSRKSSKKAKLWCILLLREHILSWSLLNFSPTFLFSFKKSFKATMYIGLCQSFYSRVSKTRILPNTYRVSQQVWNLLNVTFWSEEKFASEASYVYKILTQ